MVQALGSLSHGRVMQIAKPSLAEVPGPDEGKASLCTLPNAGLLQGDGYPAWNDSFFSFSCVEQVRF